MGKTLVSLSLALAIALYPTKSLAECDFSTIDKLPDGRYAYSVDCHKAVGKMKLDLADREEQVAKLTKTIELKDLAIRTQEQRADLWMNTALKLEDRVNAMESLKRQNEILWFVGGIALTGLAVWGAGQLK